MKTKQGISIFGDALLAKYSALWMTNADQRDPDCAAQADALIKEWHGNGWPPVIFRSGGEDLYEDTLALLKYNRDKAARREVEQERLAKAEPRTSVLAQLNRKTEPSIRAVGKRKADISR